MHTPSLLRALCALLAFTAPTLATAQAYPTKPIRLIVPYAAGGITDIAARLVASKLGGVLGQQVIVENRGGGGTRIGAEAAARSLPDGYTLLFANPVTHGTLPATARNLGFDPLRDFAPVAQLTWYATTVVCHQSVPVNNVAELLALARQAPDKLSHAHAGPGSGSHFSGELFNAMSGGQMLMVAYKGAGPAMQDVMAGLVDCTHEGAAKQYLDTGRVKAIATTGLQRDPRFPDVPTFDEAGLKGYNMTWWQGLAAPAGTPPQIIERLAQAAQAVANDADFRARAYEIGLNVTSSTPQALGRLMADDMAKYRKIAADAKLPIE